MSLTSPCQPCMFPVKHTPLGTLVLRCEGCGSPVPAWLHNVAHEGRLDPSLRFVSIEQAPLTT